MSNVNDDTGTADPEKLLRGKLNVETARIAWTDLQRFFARGVAIHVGADMDLVEVACAIACDEAGRVDGWMQQGVIAAVSDEQARGWVAEDAEVWSVVVKPWVLVQPVKPDGTPG